MFPWVLWGKVSGWPWVYCTEEDDLELRLFLLDPWGIRGQVFTTMPGDWTQGFVRAEYPINWASSVPRPKLVFTAGEEASLGTSTLCNIYASGASHCVEPLATIDTTLSTMRKVKSALGQSGWSFYNTCQSSISGWGVFGLANLPWAAMTPQVTGVFLPEADIWWQAYFLHADFFFFSKWQKVR